MKDSSKRKSQLITEIEELRKRISACEHTGSSLQENEKRYRSLFEDSRDAIFISTKEGRFIDVNHSMTDLFGFTKEEMLNLTAQDIFSGPDEWNNFREEIDKKESVRNFEIRIQKKDETEIDCILSASIRREGNKVLGYQGILHDITMRKKLEAQLLQAQKMEAIGQLAGGIAHDFNNLLTAIIGFGNLLKADVSQDPRLDSYLRQILNAADRAAYLTNELLTFSRKQTISPRPVDLNTVIREVHLLLSRIIGEDVEFSTSLHDSELFVMADSIQIEQVLMNLATNSRDAMPEGGKLTITTERTELDSSFTKAHGYGIPGAYAMLTFQDSGNGFDERTKERIFEPFFTTKDVGKGTGLGLAMVYGIVKQHRGFINVYSEPGDGAVFRIYFPLINAAAHEMQPRSPVLFRQGTETILVGEDDIQVRTLIKEVLLKSGYEILEAVDGDDTLRVFRDHSDSIHLVILDVVMPKIGAKDVFDEIRKIQPDMQVLFMSGYSSDIILKKGIPEKQVNFITKPVAPDALLAKVREMLDR